MPTVGFQDSQAAPIALLGLTQVSQVWHIPQNIF
jgi:hypothetical protein